MINQFASENTGTKPSSERVREPPAAIAMATFKASSHGSDGEGGKEHAPVSVEFLQAVEDLIDEHGLHDPKLRG